jgi:hypothetical protein
VKAFLCPVKAAAPSVQKPKQFGQTMCPKNIAQFAGLYVTSGEKGIKSSWLFSSDQCLKKATYDSFPI